MTTAASATAPETIAEARCLPDRAIELRPYQREAGRAVVRSVLGRMGETITIEIARQGGKNELSAHMELFLLLFNCERGGTIIKCAPTFDPQLSVSMRRLQARMTDAGLARVMTMRRRSIELGRASILFLSANESANVVGHTADVLLEVDEAQDVEPGKFDRDFKPMGATANVTTVMYGTPWRADSLLEREKQANLEAERAGAERRHFGFDWRTVAGHVPAYAGFIDKERERLGETHPAFLTQYCLQLAPADGRLFDAGQRALLHGEHPRLSEPLAGEVYVAGLDLAGGDAPSEPGRPHDATVLTLGRLLFPEAGALVQEPSIEVVEHYAWQGAGHETLIPRLIALLKRWRAGKVAIDATGLGETAARMLAQALGERHVDAVKFSAPEKSRLGFELIAAVNGARLRCYEPDGSTDAHEFWRQVERARVSYRAGSIINFFVNPAEGHDDYLVSLALLVRAAKDAAPRAATGRIRPGGW